MNRTEQIFKVAKELQNLIEGAAFTQCVQIALLMELASNVNDLTIEVRESQKRWEQYTSHN